MPHKVKAKISVNFLCNVAFSFKTYLLLSVDNKSGWPEAMMRKIATTRKASELLSNYIAFFGKLNGTTSGMLFTRQKFEHCQRKRLIKRPKVYGVG